MSDFTVIDVENILPPIENVKIISVKDLFFGIEADIVFVVGKSEIAEVVQKFFSLGALKILITNKKSAACGKFNSFVILPDDENFATTAEKIIRSLKYLIDLENWEFEDISSFLESAGETLFIIGEAENVSAAAKSAFLNANKNKFTKCNAVLMNVSGVPDSISLFELNEVILKIQDSITPAAEFLCEFTVDESLKNKVKIIILAMRSD